MLVGKKTYATFKVYRGMLKYMINYALCLAHYDAYFHKNGGAKKCRYLVSQIIFFLFHLNCSQYPSSVRSMLRNGRTNKNIYFSF